MQEMLFRLIIQWAVSGVDDRLLGDRLADSSQPMFPFLGASRLMFGVQ
jgi:hypothetical protein